MSRMTGQQARKILDGTTSGPWWPGRDTYSQGDRTSMKRRTVCPAGTTLPLASTNDLDPTTVTTDADIRLMAAAPALAETVAWLYGREPDEGVGPDESKTYYGTGIWYIEADPEQGVSLSYDLYRGLTPDEAVELGRSLINAADEARGG